MPSTACQFGIVVEDTSQLDHYVPEKLEFLGGLGISWDLSVPSMKKSSMRLEGQVGGSAMNVTVGHSWGNGMYNTMFVFNEGGRNPTPVAIANPLLLPSLKFSAPLSLRGDIKGRYSVPLVANQFQISIDKARFYVNSDNVASIHGSYAYNFPLAATASSSSSSSSSSSAPTRTSRNQLETPSPGSLITCTRPR